MAQGPVICRKREQTVGVISLNRDDFYLYPHAHTKKLKAELVKVYLWETK